MMMSELENLDKACEMTAAHGEGRSAQMAASQDIERLTLSTSESSRNGGRSTLDTPADKGERGQKSAGSLDEVTAEGDKAANG